MKTEASLTCVCQKCGKTLRLPKALAGKQVKCGACGASLVAPQVSAKTLAPREAPSKTVGKRISRRRPAPKQWATPMQKLAVLLASLVVLILLITTLSPDHPNAKPSSVGDVVHDQAPKTVRPPERASSTPNSSQVPHSEAALEYKLAVIDNDGYVSDSDPSVARFRSLLSQLSSTYTEDGEAIADMTVAAQRLLKEKYGVTESLRNIMEGMNQVFYSRIPNQKYAEYVAAYIQLRNKGMAHRQAVESLAALVQGLSGN